VPEPPGFTAATYNIHRGIGRGGRADYGRIVDVIAALDADLIALQEVETPLRSTPMSLLRMLHEMGYSPVLGATLTRMDCRYGNVLLTRLPPLGHDLVDLSLPRREPRGLIELRVDTAPARGTHPRPGAPLRCLATHLGLGGGERRRQIARLLRWLEGPWQQGGWRAGDTGGCPTLHGYDTGSVSHGSVPASEHLADPPSAHLPVLLLGDFNEWRRASPRLAELHRRFRSVPTAPTYPARWPLFALDRIFYRGPLRLQRWEALETPLSRQASDHLPLRARFSLAPIDAQPGLPLACSRPDAVQ
jgi:endonuclease/exonuclease/phosphatase family metal-dependent hydrolase